MAKKDALLANVAASNKLKMSPTVITAGEAWRNQAQGVYHILYKYMQGDFAHFGDVSQWINDTFNAHKHTGNKGSPTSPPLVTAPLKKDKSKSFLISMSPFGKVRKGFIKLKLIVQAFVSNDERLKK